MSVNRFLDSISNDEFSMAPPSTRRRESSAQSIAKTPRAKITGVKVKNNNKLSSSSSGTNTSSDYLKGALFRKDSQNSNNSTISDYVEHVDKNQKKDYYPKDNYNDEGVTPLMSACQTNNLNKVIECLSKGYTVEQYDSHGRTALFIAATHSSTEIIQLLLQHKANPFLVAGYYDRNCLHQACSRPVEEAYTIATLFIGIMGESAKLEQDKAGLLPIHIAINNGNVELVKDLLSTHTEDQIKAVTIEYKDCALHLAARKKNLELVELFIENGSIVDQQNSEGQTALHIACYEQDIETVRFLGESKATVNLKDKRNRAPIHLATVGGNLEIVKMLTEEFHSDLNMRSRDGSTLLHLAAKCGHPNIAMYYVSKGVLIQMPNKDGAAALHEAARQGHANVINALISKGANINTVTKEGFTSLHIAVNYGKHMVVQVLLGEGASVNDLGGVKKETALHLAAKLPRFSEQVVQMLLKSGARVDTKNGDGDTALHIAVRHKNYTVAKMLKSEGVNPSDRNNIGETPLHVAVSNLSVAIALELIDDMKTEMTEEEFITALNTRNAKGETALHYCGNIQPKMESKQTYVDMSKLIIDNHAELSVLEDLKDENPLHYCCHTGNAEVMKMILAAMPIKESNKVVNQPNKAGWSPMLIACKGGYTSVVRVLLDYQARIDLFDEEGKNSLHVACENGMLEVAEILLEKKAYPNAKTKLGETPVSIAAGKGHYQLVEILINKYKAQFDIPALNKQVSLHAAAENGHLHACKSLLEFGADPMTKDSNGQTPIHNACENDHPQVVKMFLEQFSELGSVTNKEGNNCAHIAASKGSLEVMKMLVKNDKEMISVQNKITGQLPIHLAALGGHMELLELLIENGTPLMEEDKEGMNALLLAIKNGHRQVVEFLKAKISLSVPSAKTGFYPVHIAAQYDQTVILQDILTKVAAHTLSECPLGKVPEETDYGWTPLHLAAKYGNEGAIRVLLICDDIVIDHPTSKEKNIPLHMAIIEGHSEAASLLLARSADQIFTKDFNGRAAIHFASANGHIQLVQLLLGQGAEINGVDNSNWTPLHYAANAGNLEVCHFLVTQDASTIMKSTEDKFPIIYAGRNLHPDCMKYLFMREYDVEDLLADSGFIGDIMACSIRNDNETLLDFILNSPEPIYTSIKITKRYLEEAEIQKARSQDFTNIADFSKEVTYDLLHLTAPKGTEPLLNATDVSKKALLDLFIDHEFKECVAHPSVQSYVSDIWAGDIDLSGTKGTILLTLMFLIPPLWFFLCLPFSRWSRIPTLKFACHVISHIYFILVLILCVAVPWDRSGEEIYPTPWECLLYIWLIALFLSIAVEDEFNAIRLVCALLSAIAIGLHVLAVFEEKHDRETLIYFKDNIFAFVLTALFAQIFQFLSMHEMFGPWTVIIYALILDVLKFLILLFGVIGAFTLHMAVIYKPAYGKARVDLPTSLVPLNIQSFQSLFKDLFFACFGLSSIPNEELTAVERNDSPPETGLLAVIVFAIYEIVVITVLVNLLIAMMSNTYTIIDERSDLEWKYGRAKLIWNMTKTSSVPMPANIVATFIVFFKVISMSSCLCCLTNIRKAYQEMLLYGSLEEESEDAEIEEELTIEDGTRTSIEKVANWKQIKYEYYETHDLEEKKPWLKSNKVEDGGNKDSSEA